MSELCVNLDKLINSNDKEQFIQKFEDSLTLNAIAQSSNTALDDSSDQQIKIDSEKRNKMHKVHSKINGHPVKKHIVKSGTKSDSESSLDPWFNQQKEMDHGLSNEYTDSDEPFQSDDDDVCDPVAWRQYASNIGESDSITEGQCHFREPRRKRKLKRMAIDPPVELTKEFMSNDTSFPLKNKRIRNAKMQKEPKMLNAPEFPKLLIAELPMPLFCGKRKRSEEKSADNSDNDLASEKFIDSASEEFLESAFMKSCEKFAKCMTLKSDSEESSSESECALSTNDESREADDEQSDFFFESGPSKKVLNSDDGKDKKDDDNAKEDDDEEEEEDDDDEADDEDDDDEEAEDDEEEDEEEDDDDEDDEEDDENDYSMDDEEVQETAASEEKMLCKLLEQTSKPQSPAFQMLADRMFEQRKKMIKEYLEKKYGKVPNSKIGARIFSNKQPKYEDDRLRFYIAAAEQRRLRHNARIIASANDELMAEDSDRKEPHKFQTWAKVLDSMPSSEKKARCDRTEEE